MVRIKSSVVAHKRKKAILKKAKGQFGQRSKRYRQAIKSVVKGMTYEFRDRKVKKRLFKNLWVIRINAACKEKGIAYNRFINGLKKANVEIDRKILADLAVNASASFEKLVKVAQEAHAAKAEKKVAKEEKTSEK